jgi:hypothetical protein
MFFDDDEGNFFICSNDKSFPCHLIKFNYAATKKRRAAGNPDHENISFLQKKKGKWAGVARRQKPLMFFVLSWLNDTIRLLGEISQTAEN